MCFKFCFYCFGFESNGLVLFNCIEVLKGIVIIIDVIVGL